MAKVLSGYRGLGKQTSAGVFRDSSGSSGSFVGGVPMAQSATTSNGSDPQGVEFFIAVKMADQTIEANRPHFEYMIASYDLTSSVYTWNRVSTIDSSNGGAAVDWESITTDENSLTFYAITPHTVFNYDGWHLVGGAGNPAFENTWENFGSGTEPLRYRKKGDVVEVRGLIRNGTTGTACFTLPSGFRPQYIMNDVGLTNSPSSVIRINVDTAGSFKILNTEVSFSSIAYSFPTS